MAIAGHVTQAPCTLLANVGVDVREELSEVWHGATFNNEGGAVSRSNVCQSPGGFKLFLQNNDPHVMTGSDEKGEDEVEVVSKSFTKKKKKVREVVRDNTRFD